MPTDRPPNLILRQARRFGLLSGLSFVVNLGVTVVLAEALDVPVLVAVGVAMVVTTLVNFSVLRWYVFPQTGQSLGGQFMAFVLSIAGFRGAEYFAMIVLHSLLGLHYLPSYVAILIASLIGKFLILRMTVFQTRLRTLTS